MFTAVKNIHNICMVLGNIYNESRAIIEKLQVLRGNCQVYIISIILHLPSIFVEFQQSCM